MVEMNVMVEMKVACKYSLFEFFLFVLPLLIAFPFLGADLSFGHHRCNPLSSHKRSIVGCPILFCTEWYTLSFVCKPNIVIGVVFVDVCIDWQGLQ